MAGAGLALALRGGGGKILIAGAFVIASIAVGGIWFLVSEVLTVAIYMGHCGT